LADTSAKKPVIILPVRVRTDTLVVNPDTIAVIPGIPVIKSDSVVIRPAVPLILTDTLAVKIDTMAVKPVEIKAEEPVVDVEPVILKPKYTLHVGEFRKRSQAEKAQRKVMSKFDLPEKRVFIFMKWDSYHLVISGFYDKKETTPYFPELVGMGYTNIFVPEK
jgi:hypothetical protein